MDEKPDAAKVQPPTLEDTFHPWELLGQSRRDCASHRGPLLIWMARVSLIAGGLSFVFPPAGLFGLLVGLATRGMARRDLDAIFAGDMDHRGYQQTKKARADGQAGAVVGLLGCVFWLIVFAPLVYAFLSLGF